MEKKSWLKFFVIYILFSLFLASVLAVINKINFLSTLRITFGWLYVLFLPGYLIIRLFFEEITDIETFLYSFGISLMVIVAMGLLLNWLWEITLISILISLTGFITIELIGLVIKWKIKKAKKKQKLKNKNE